MTVVNHNATVYARVSRWTVTIVTARWTLNACSAVLASARITVVDDNVAQNACVSSWTETSVTERIHDLLANAIVQAWIAGALVYPVLAVCSVIARQALTLELNRTQG